MPIAEDYEPPDRRKAILQIAVVVVVGGIVVWLAGGGGMAQLTALVSPSKSPKPASVAPSPSAELTCRPAQLVLTGAFNGCADPTSQAPSSCGGAPAGAFHGLARVQDRLHAYLLYLEVDGGYHGPATYPLVTWPHPSLGVGDRVAKVAVRETSSGALWRSAGGVVTIDGNGDSGSVRAGLDYDGAEATVLALKVEGPWRCG